MDKKIEYDFVKAYIVKNKQDRILFELNSRNKRKDAVCRFCHRTHEHIKAQNIIYEDNKIPYEILHQYFDKTNEKECYIISYYDDFDGKLMKSNDIFSYLIGMGMPSIAVFNKLVFIETEQIKDSAIKFVLKS